MNLRAIGAAAPKTYTHSRPLFMRVTAVAIRFSQQVLTEGARNLSGRLRPSGRFSFVQVFPKKKKVLNHAPTENNGQDPLHSLSQLDESYKRISSGGGILLHKVLDGLECDVQDIGSSIAANSDIRSPRGFKGISSAARDILCWAANQIERVYTRGTMSFLTLTLPELSEADLGAVQGGWSKIVNDVVREIKRELDRHGIQTAVVGCTELQLERGEQDGKSWPHLHLVFRGRRDSQSGWVVRPARFREIWARCVGRVAASGAYSWESSENVQQVRKASGGYLAKYISKGQSKGAKKIRGVWHPSDWIICSRRLRGLYKTLTVSGHDIASTLANVCVNWRYGMGYKQPVIISTPGYGDRIIGQWGWLKGEAIFLSPQEWFATC